MEIIKFLLATDSIDLTVQSAMDSPKASPGREEANGSRESLRREFQEIVRTVEQRKNADARRVSKQGM